MYGEYDNPVGMTFRAVLDADNMEPGVMTDAGIRVADLQPIENCVLTPGDPAPIGRTKDGDLVYPEYPDRTWVYFARANAAQLAHIVAKAHGMTSLPEPPFAEGSPERLIIPLINAALPRAFYEPTAHGDLARATDINRILAGEMDAVSRHWAPA